jgi:hypothetical protein
MTALQTKILNYSPEQYWLFDTAPGASSYTPTNLGSSNNGTQSFTVNNGLLSSVVTGGAPDGGNCTAFFIGKNATTNPTTRYIITSNTHAFYDPEINDGDFGIGIWFKFNGTFNTGTAQDTDYRILNLFYRSRQISVDLFGGTANNANKGKLAYKLQSEATQYTADRFDDNEWHYVAIRFLHSGTQDTTSEIYIDGQFVRSFTQTTSLGGTNQLAFGQQDQTLSDINFDMLLSHVHIMTRNNLSAAAISDIWNFSGPTNVTINETPATASALFVDPAISTQINNEIVETPATASALFVDPTIIVTTPNYTHVTTSISVSAELLDNISVSATQNLDFIVTTTMDASAELINNVNVVTGSDDSFSAAEFTASAEFIEPVPFARAPMTASAIMPNAVDSVTPNYRKLVKQLNPSLYIADAYLADPNQSLVPIIPNDGNDNWGTYFADSQVRVESGPSPMTAIGNGNSITYLSGGSAALRQWGFVDSNADTQSIYFISEGTNNVNDFTIEFWVNFRSINSTLTDFIDFGPVEILLSSSQIRYTASGQEIPNDGFGPVYTHTANFVSSINNWNHFVITGNYSNSSPYLTTQIWYNGSVIGTASGRYVYDSANIPAGITFNPGSGSSVDARINQVALYKSVLSNANIVEHYNFIATSSPNRNMFADPMEANADSGDHVFLVTSNAIISEAPAEASGVIVSPTLIIGVSKENVVNAFVASCQLPYPLIRTGSTIVETPATAYAESNNAVVLNNTYYNYVIANINPYRYVTFDAADVYKDYGTDNDYAVAPTLIGGIVVNPGDSINGKSAKTAGISYTTDGVILKESEHDDNWGTGNASWHSSFWFKQAPEDTSTGLRVLWNLNGAYDNQNSILYHYQNKLHLQINNQVGSPITITSANNVNIFDLERHFIVIESHHNNNKNHVYVYVDSVLVLDQDIDTYAITTINNPIHVGANDEANNFARLGVGCLITPFGFTALPVVPTNTILYVDEIYWDKNDIDQTMINNLWNVMPDANNNNSAADPFEASALSVNPTFSTTVDFLADPMTASCEFVNPVLYTEMFVDFTTEAMTANAEMLDAERVDSANILSDVMIATAIFDNAGIVISFQAEPMNASALSPSRAGFVFYGPGNNPSATATYYFPDTPSAYVRYVRSKSYLNTILKPKMEIM